jgi:hypothetical protein
VYRTVRTVVLEAGENPAYQIEIQQKRDKIKRYNFPPQA